jgi:4-amino-4-deoxychorismate lyase
MPLPAHWVNLQQESSLDVRDRGFAYGDGLFETLRCHRGRIHLPQNHLQRLQRGCERLGFDYPGAQVHEHFRVASTYLQDHDIADATLRLGVSRGMARDTAQGRGYGGAHGQPTIVLSLYAATLPWRCVPAPARLICYGTPLAAQPLLAGIKHCNRLEQVLAARKAREEGVDEAIMLNDRGQVICGISANLFLVTGGRMITPFLSECGVEGTVRELILERLANDCMIHVEQASIERSDLFVADELILSNSLIGIQSVSGLEGHSYSSTVVADRLRSHFFDYVDRAES